MGDCGILSDGDCGINTAMVGSPAIYCCARPLCEKFVDELLLPFLGSANGQNIIKNVTGPLWRGCDMINGRDCKSAERPSGLNAAKAVVVLTIRPVMDVAKYKEVYAAYAKKVQAKTSGVRAFFSFASA